MAETGTPSTRNFRENLKHFFDLARKNPIAINRGTERYILMSENEFAKMKEEVMNLQKSLISMLGMLNGDKGAEYSDTNHHYDELLEQLLNEEEKIEKSKRKKIVG